MKIKVRCLAGGCKTAMGIVVSETGTASSLLFQGRTRIRCLLACCLVALGGTWSGYSESKQSIAFAGVAFHGSAKDRDTLFRYSGQLPMEEVNRQLTILLEKSPPKHIEPVPKFVGFSDEPLVLACAVTSETIAYEKSIDGYLVAIRICAEALVIDFKSRSVVASCPFSLSLRDYLEQQPQEADLLERVRLSYLDAESEKTVLKAFVSSIAEWRPRSKIGASLQVREVHIETNAFKFLPSYYRTEANALKQWLAQEFSSELSYAHKVSVLPYAKSMATAEMALRFSNGSEVINLSIPEPSYCVDLTLLGFSKTKYKETAAETAWLYGSYFNIRFYQKLLGRDYLNEAPEHGYVRVVRKGKEDLDDWFSFERSITELCNEYASELGSQKKHKEVKEALEKCKY